MNHLRVALRALLRQRAFSFTAIMALAVGIGAATTMFSVVHSVLLRPFPYREPGRILTILGRDLRTGDLVRATAPANYYDLASLQQAFDSIAAAEAWSATLTGEGEPEQVPAMRVTAGMRSVLGVEPALGRWFDAGREQPGQHRVALISHQLWQRRFGSDPAIVGKTVAMNGEPFEIAGVMPERFRFAPFWHTKAQIWAPLAFTPERRANRTGSSLRVFGRLKPGLAPAQAQQDADRVAAALALSHPDSNRELGAAVRSLDEMAFGPVRNALWLLMGAVSLVLLAACANVANLLLARGVSRRHEIAVRFALGAAPRHVLRQLFTESLVLAITGGIAGLLLSFWAVDGLRLAFAQSRLLARADEIAIRPEVALFALAASLVTAILFGILPAWQSARNAHLALRQGARGSAGGAASSRSLLVAAEIALTVVLLAGAGLLGRSLWRMMNVDPGFDADHVLTAVVNPGGTRSLDPSRRIDFYRDLHRRLSRHPQIRAVGLVNHIPLAGDTWSAWVLLEGQDSTATAGRATAVYRVAGPGYFSAMGSTLVQGRDLAGSDRLDTPPVAVVNQSFARRFFPDGALNRRFRTGLDRPWLTIVGVVGDLKQSEWTAAPRPEMYLHYAQDPEYFRSPWSNSMTVVIRGAGDLASLGQLVKSEVWSVDRSIPVSQVLELDQIVSASLREPRLFAALMSAFAAIALLLAAIGIYGVISHAVLQRTREIGIRMALGAAAGDVLGLVLKQGLGIASLGLAVGLAAALLLSRFLESLLFGVAPHDTATLAAVAAVALCAAALASLVPAARAVRIDPVTALRQD